jgi:hypothetical protein
MYGTAGCGFGVVQCIEASLRSVWFKLHGLTLGAIQYQECKSEKKTVRYSHTYARFSGNDTDLMYITSVI